MNKEAIIKHLQSNYRQFAGEVVSLSEFEFDAAPPGKWSAGRQLDHLVRSTFPVALAFALPKFVFRLLFGKPNRPPRNYEALVQRYQERLAQGGKASGPYIPQPVQFQIRERLAGRLESNVATLCRRIEGWREDELDSYLLPHPLIGKLTLREMLFFTIYHAEHHRKLVGQYLKELRT